MATTIAGGEPEKAPGPKEDEKIRRGKAFQFTPKTKKTPNQSANDKYRDAASTPEDIDKFRLAPADPSTLGLWEQAWEQVKAEEDDWKSWPQFQSVKDLKTKDVVHEVHGFAQKRRDEANKNQRHVLGTSLTYRKMCGKVAKCAKKFEIVGDLVAQAEPVYAALPWVKLRICTSLLAQADI